jgi:hypothetical protein
MGEALSCHSKSVGSTVDDLSGFAALDLPSCNAIVGREAKPGGKVLFRGKGIRIKTHLGEDGMHRDRIQSIDLGKVGTADPVEMAA